jgi:hypothetical protein
MNKPSKLISESNANPAETSTPVNDGPSGPTDDGPQTPLKLVSPQKEEELDEDEREFRAMRRDLAGTQGESAIGIVAISVGKTPEKNEYFRTHPDSRPVIPVVNTEIGMEKKFFACHPTWSKHWRVSASRCLIMFSTSRSHRSARYV